ncbi:hypothetical protein MMC30_003007 [Trapelia coarctata]|nr:hypothetical protein [Trapelia coarctata]
MHRRYRSSFGSNAPSTAVAAPISFETEDQKMIMRRLKHAKVKRYDGDDFGDDGDEWDDVGYYDEFGVWNGQVSTPKKAPRRVEWEAVEGGWHAVEGIASLALGS